tara:strand:- start:1232 stop:1510 length:279 start_codon:yes stop_codon:yes gene_type:complete
MSKKPVNLSEKPRGKHDNEARMIRRFMKKMKKYKVLEGYREKQYFEKPSEKRRNQAKKRQKVIDKLKAEEKRYNEVDFDKLPSPKKKRKTRR